MPRSSKPDVGVLPKIPHVEEDIRRWAMWEHIRFARSHGKRIPLKPRRRLSEEEAVQLRRDLECLAHHVRHALSYMNMEEK